MSTHVFVNNGCSAQSSQSGMRSPIAQESPTLFLHEIPHFPPAEVTSSLKHFWLQQDDLTMNMGKKIHSPHDNTIIQKTYLPKMINHTFIMLLLSTTEQTPIIFYIILFKVIFLLIKTWLKLTQISSYFMN